MLFYPSPLANNFRSISGDGNREWTRDLETDDGRRARIEQYVEFTLGTSISRHDLASACAVRLEP